MPIEPSNYPQHIDQETGEVTENPQVIFTQAIVVDSRLPSEIEDDLSDDDDYTDDPKALKERQAEAEDDAELAAIAAFEPTLTGYIKSHRAGRKSKLTPRFIKKFEALMVQGNYPDTVCTIMNITRQTYWRWMTVGREINEQFEEFRENGLFDMDKPEGRLAAVEYLGYERLEVLKYDFFRMVEHAEREAEARMVGIIFKAGLADPYWAHKLLESRHPEHWGKKRLEITGANGGPIEVGSASDDNDQDEKAKIDRVQRILQEAKNKGLLPEGI